MRPAEPKVVYDDDGADWTLLEEYVVTSRGYTLVVPKGRVTDFASIPRVFWNLEAPFQLSCGAPTVHDELYRHGGLITIRTATGEQVKRFTKADADAFFLDLMTQFGVPRWRRYSAYYAVRWFGASSWQGSH